MPEGRDDSLLPFENTEEFFGWSAKKLAEGIIGGLASAIVGEIVDKLLGQEPSTQELLEEAVRRFAQKVEAAIEEEALRQAKVLFSTLNVGIGEVRRDLANLGPSWWSGYDGEVEILRIMDLDSHARALLENLNSLGLAGWQTYMLAGSIRLRIFATLMQVPGRESAERDNIAAAIELYVNHHWDMCQEVAARVWPEFEIKSAYTYRCCWPVHPTKPYHYFPVFTDVLLDLLRKVKITNHEWLSKMPPVADIGTSSSRDWHKKYGVGPREEWLYWKSGSLNPNVASAIYAINELSGFSVETIDRILRMRRSEFELWVWSQYNKGPVGSFHNITVQWWSGQELTKVRRVAIRASNRKYVCALIGADNRGTLYSVKNHPHPWGIFELITREDDKIALRAQNRHYVAAELHSQYHEQQDYEGELTANRVRILEWEKFQQIDLGDNKVALLAANGKYVSLKETAEPEVEAPKLVAFTDHISDEAIFELVEVRNGRWRHNNLSRAAGAPPGADTLTGYTWDIDKTQHVVYQGEDRHIHELWFHQDSGWHHNNLSVAISGIPSSIGNLVGYTWSVDKTQHIVYVDPNYNVRELWFRQDSGWHQNNLTAATDAPLARGDLTGYTWHVDSAQHIVYRGRDNHLHELSFSRASGWKHKDLTSEAGAALANEGLSGYTWDVDETQHVVYRGEASHIYELWFHQDSGWHRHDLTETTGAPSARSAPMGYTWDIDRTQHVVYRGQDSHVHELWFHQDSGWHHNNLTVATGAPLAASDPNGYTWDADETQHVVYRSQDGHIHELWFHQDSGWHHHDLTEATGAPSARSGPVGYTWDLDGTQHVVYLGADDNIHELWFARWEGA